MNGLRSLVFLFLAQSFFLASCHGGQEQKTDAATIVDSAAVDSDALVLSLTPTVECLPFYYAREAGIFKTLGLKVRLETYTSQFDCDTAILGTTAIGGATDLIRLHHYVNNGKHLTAVAAMDGQWNLLASARLRIKKTALLQNRMIAVARHSTSDFFSEAALEKAKLEYNDVFRPQINQYDLRANMLNNQQVDAAILPEPYATQARLSGHRVLYRSQVEDGRMGCLVFRPSVLAAEDSVKMVRDILKAYNQAIADLNKKGISACWKIFRNEYKIAPEAIDSISLPKYQKAALPSEQDIKRAKDFLKAHGRWSLKEYPSEMFNGELLPR